MLRKLLFLFFILFTACTTQPATLTSEPVATVTTIEEITIATALTVTSSATATVLNTPIATPTPRPTIPPPSENCLAFLQVVETTISDTCNGMQVNQVCYGNPQIEAEFLSDALSFTKPGDTVPLFNVQRLVLSAMNADLDIWGIAIVDAQATVENTIPGQNVRFIVYGNTQFEVEEQTEDMVGAFYLQTGITRPTCNSASEEGFIVQSPEGIADIQFQLNDVVVTMPENATSVFQIEDDLLNVYALEGSTQVMSRNQTRTIVSGQVISVRIGRNRRAIAAPSAPEPYEPDRLALTPLGALLRSVLLPDPYDQPSHVPISGQWQLTFDVDSQPCPDGTVWPFRSTGTISIQAQQDGFLYENILHTFYDTGSYIGAYTSGTGDTYTNVLVVIASDFIRGTTTIDFASRDCTLQVPFTLQLVRPN